MPDEPLPMTPAQKLASEQTGRPYRSCVASPLRNAGLAAGLTLKRVSEALGIQIGYLSQVEIGKSHPSLPMAFRMARFYGTTVDALFGPLLDETKDQSTLA